MVHADETGWRICFTAYDHQNLRAWLQQKCLGHLLQNLGKLRETKTHGAIRFAQDVTAVLQAALVLRDEKPTLTPRQFRRRANQLERCFAPPRPSLTLARDPDQSWNVGLTPAPAA